MASREYYEILKQAKIHMDKHEHRQAADVFWNSFCACSSHWSLGRYDIFTYYTEILIDGRVQPTHNDVENLRSVLDDENEVGIFRINAGTILASVSGNAFNEFEDAADYFRQAISLADAVSKKELRKCKGIFINPAHDAQSIVQDMRDNCATNLKGMENPISVPVLRGDATERPPPLRMQTSDGISFEVQPDYVVFPNVADMEGRLATGGKECDFCNKTLAQLGITRLSTCTRCKMTYYCSKECQKAAWKAGHKTACREPNQRERGDVMQLKEHGNELSQVVTLVEEQPNKQWKVTTMLFCRPKTLIVDSDQLVHIRPAK